MMYFSFMKFFPNEGANKALLLTDDEGNGFISLDGKTFTEDPVIDFIMETDRYKKAGSLRKLEWLQQGFQNVAFMSMAAVAKGSLENALETLWGQLQEWEPE